jgi:hypothetical protein
MALNDKDSEYLEQFELRQQTRAAIAGKYEVVKQVKCLPAPHYKNYDSYAGMSREAHAQAVRCNAANSLRIADYWARGRWLPATGRTFETSSGMVWSKEPDSDIQRDLEFLIDNADGTGCGLREVAQKTIDRLIADARYGILVDMPSSPTDADGNRVKLTRAQNDSGQFLPKWIRYNADNILPVRSSGGSKAIDEIRLVEVRSEKKNEFDYEDKIYTRRLIMIDGVYHNQLFNDKDELLSDVAPIAGGEFLTEIPFQFFGADDNSAEYSKLPLYELGNKNMGHFVLDCDNRSLLHRYSQGMTNIYVSDGSTFTEDNPNGLNVNGDGVNQFGDKDRVEILQLEAGTAIPDAMKVDVNDLVMSGAQFVTDSNANETLGAKRIDANASISSLKRIVFNTTNGFTRLLEWTAAFRGVVSTSTYKLNSDFITDDLTPEMINAHIALVQGNILPAVTLNETARKAQLTDLSNDDIAIELSNQNALVGGTSEDQASIQAQLDAALEEIAALKASE